MVNEQDVQVGTMDKLEAHRQARLHRAFSIFIFNSNGEMLLQQRAAEKYHSGGLWTNACCSHPSPGEDTEAAAMRRLQEEMGFTTPVTEIFNFTYKAAFDNGLVEHEFDHVYIGLYDGEVHPDADEVQDFCFRDLDEIRAQMEEQPEAFTAWFHIAFPKLEEWLMKNKLELQN